jgi:hypothetical protein
VNFLSQIPYALETLLEFLLLFLLVRGPFRKYLVFSVYILFRVLGNVIEGSALHLLGFKSGVYRNVYWTCEVTMDLFLFLVVIAFTYAALDGNPLRPKAAKALGGIVVVALALPLYMLRHHHNKMYGAFTSQWFNQASQIWNFGAAVMNLVLWTALLSNRRRDPQLVTLSIGVGLATASAAIGWGARQWLAEANRWPVDIFMAVAGLASILLWCWAFRRKAPGHSSTTQPPSNAPSPQALTTPS